MGAYYYRVVRYIGLLFGHTTFREGHRYVLLIVSLVGGDYNFFFV